LVLNFSNPEDQAVLFTSCESDADTHMYLFASNWTSLMHESLKGCYGDDCHIFGSRFECSWLTESFVVDLEEGDYYLVLNMWGDYDGNYSIEVQCGIYVDNFTASTSNSPYYPNTTWSWNYNVTSDSWNSNTTWNSTWSPVNTTNSPNTTWSPWWSTTSTTSDNPSCHYFSENFLMQNLSAGDYYLKFNENGWYNGDYTIEVSCGNATDHIDTDGYDDSTSTWNPHYTYEYAGELNCGDTVYGTQDDKTLVYYTLKINYTQNVLITNCDSDYDTGLHLLTWYMMDITNQSVNGCDGDDCSYDHPNHDDCHWLREIIVMEDLAAGTYYVDLNPQWIGDRDGNYTLEVVCGDDVGIADSDESTSETTTSTSSPFNFPDSYWNTSAWGNISFGDIQCGETMEGTLNSNDVLFLNFSLSEKQDVLFTNCESDFDTKMYLISNGSTITSESTNECDGDDCYHGSYCDTLLRETFLMEDLNEGNYYLEVSAYGGNGGEYEVEVSCATDENWDDVLDLVNAANPFAVMVSMAVTAAALLV